MEARRERRRYKRGGTKGLLGRPAWDGRHSDRRLAAVPPSPMGVQLYGAVYPLKRLSHVGRVIVAAPSDPAIPRHVGFDAAASVEEALARAGQLHGKDCSIAYIQQAPLPSAFARA